MTKQEICEAILALTEEDGVVVNPDFDDTVIDTMPLQEICREWKALVTLMTGNGIPLPSAFNEQPYKLNDDDFYTAGDRE